jgi:hypothetical protein
MADGQSMIYFPVYVTFIGFGRNPRLSQSFSPLTDLLTLIRYAHMKKDVFSEGKQGKVLSLGELLISAGIGGIPAA